MPTPRISIIGAGRLGKSLGRLLSEVGYPIAALANRTRASTEAAAKFVGAGRVADSPSDAARDAEVVFIATPDDAVESVCREIAEAAGFRKGALVFHFSGALGSDVLAAAREHDAFAAALHPIQSFPTAEDGVNRMAGTVFTFEGDPEAWATAEALVTALGGRLLTLDAEGKALYHAACCVVSNYLVTVVDLGLALMEEAGFTREDGMAALLPLIRGTVSNMESLGIPHALTGPIARGDARTVERHLADMPEALAAARRLYTALGRHTLEVALAKGGLSPQTARELRDLLGEAGDC